jgi:hypothetical protein
LSGRQLNHADERALLSDRYDCALDDRLECAPSIGAAEKLSAGSAAEKSCDVEVTPSRRVGGPRRQFAARRRTQRTQASNALPFYEIDSA